jgi:hypothetical protein
MEGGLTVTIEDGPDWQVFVDAAQRERLDHGPAGDLTVGDIRFRREC